MKDRNKRIFVAGHHGMVGSALLRQLKAEGFTNVVTRDRVALDLTRQQDVENFFLREHFDLVYLAAARVGGIAANNAFPADFIYQNLIIECNVIHSAHMAGIDRLIFLGSSCIYPKYAAQPLKETDLLFDYRLQNEREKTCEEKWIVMGNRTGGKNARTTKITF